MSWQPIASAPKGQGVRIIVCDGQGWVGEVWWMDSWFGNPEEAGWVIANCDEEYGLQVAATHWMPLPEPPK